MQPVRSFEVEPQLLLPNSRMCLGGEHSRIPTAEALIIQLGGVARYNDAARELEQRRKKTDMIALTIVVLVDASSSPSAWKVGGITVDQFAADKALGSKELTRICFDIRSKRWEKALPASDYYRVPVNSDAPARRFLVPKDGTSAQMRLNVGGVGRKDVNDVLIAFPLPTWVPHGTIIVISGDDVKRFRGSDHVRY